MKKRVFAAVEDNSKRGMPCAILGLDEEGEKLFRVEVEGAEDFKRMPRDTDSPAARAFAAFERFCKEECGLKDCNDEVIFAEEELLPDTLADYVDFRLGCADWAVVKHLRFECRYEMAHLKEPLKFIEVLVYYGQGMPEPYATRRIYQKYRKYIHKDTYTEEEICRMEEFIFARLGDIYRRRRGRSDAILRICHPCAAIYRSDRMRFLRIIEKIVADYQGRRSEDRRYCLREILVNTAELVFCEGEIDLASLPGEERKPPLEREEYALYAALPPDALQTAKELIEEYEGWK